MMNNTISKLFASLMMVSIAVSASSAYGYSDRITDAIAQQEIVVVLHENNSITVDGECTSFENLREVVKSKIHDNKNARLKVILYFGSNVEYWDEFDAFLDDAPPGSGIVFLTDDEFSGC